MKRAESAVEPKKTSKKSVAKVKKERRNPESAIEFTWNLHDLPSAQHKAGLAGLVLCVESLKRSGGLRGICEAAHTSESKFTLRANRDGMQSLFDDVYAAALEDQHRKDLLKKKDKSVLEPKATIEKPVTDEKGVTKTKTFYVYEQTIPRAALIDEWDTAENKLWLKLWRDLVWTTLRGVPATREPYDARAEKRLIEDGAEVWDELADFPDKSVDLPSTYYLGAQAFSAENVSFSDIAKHRCLLHFWPFAVPIYVPANINREGEREFCGYAIAVPDIQILDAFVEDWPTFSRERQSAAAGYRPASAVIDVAAESALDMFRRFVPLLSRRLGSGSMRSSIGAVDVFHIQKEGNNVNMRFTGRVDLTRARTNEYALIRDSYWSPVFRRQRILNLLEDMPWYAKFGRLCATTPSELTIQNKQFQHDCRQVFKELEMTESNTSDEYTLEHYVYITVRYYVAARLRQKKDLDWKSAQGDKAAEDKYSEEKSRLARSAFLAVRSRTGKDFVDYFTGTLCSVSQRVGERGYHVLACALFDESQVEKVRSLTLLALSANA
jgi:CRISPR-associated protein Cmx8